MGHLTGLVRHPACKFKKEIREIQLATKCQHLEKNIDFYLTVCLSVSAQCRRMLNSFWSCSWYLITEKNIIYSKALAKQEEPKQLLGCPKNGCHFLNYHLPVSEEEITVQCVPSKTKVTDFWSINNRFGTSWFVRALTGMVLRLHQNVFADPTWICHYNKIFAVIWTHICSLCLGFQGCKKYFIITHFETNNFRNILISLWLHAESLPKRD